jgi:hypothetical protein
MKPGDEVTYTPHDRRYEEPVTGFVAEEVLAHGGDTGYNLLCPLPGDAGRTLRFWNSRGTFTPTGRVADWAAPVKEGAPKSVAEVRERLPYRRPSDLASEYRAAGMDRQRAWSQFVKDTILMPRYRSEPVDAKAFFKMGGW